MKYPLHVQESVLFSAYHGTNLQSNMVRYSNAELRAMVEADVNHPGTPHTDIERLEVLWRHATRAA